MAGTECLPGTDKEAQMHALRKLVIILCGLVMTLLWGLPMLLAPAQTAGFFGFDFTVSNAAWMRLLGMMFLLWGIMLIAAAACNDKLVVLFTVILTLFVVVLALLMMFWLGEIDAGKWVWWGDIVLLILMFLVLALFHPKKEAEAKPKSVAQVPPQPPKPEQTMGTTKPSM
jgi:peptidoglycan/LPS O-acetylase OafA/YrhL